MTSASDDHAHPLTPAELEIELARLTLVVDAVSDSAVVRQARGHGLPHPGVEAFLRQCTRLMALTPPARQKGLIERLDRLGRQGGLGILGLEAWLTDPSQPLDSVDDAAAPAHRMQHFPRAVPPPRH